MGKRAQEGLWGERTPPHSGRPPAWQARRGLLDPPEQNPPRHPEPLCTMPSRPHVRASLCAGFRNQATAVVKKWLLVLLRRLGTLMHAKQGFKGFTKQLILCLTLLNSLLVSYFKLPENPVA